MIGAYGDKQTRVGQTISPKFCYSLTFVRHNLYINRIFDKKKSNKEKIWIIIFLIKNAEFIYVNDIICLIKKF